uniref:Uncharacterized protein n=1 Tax=Meloidogyne incognita TaxID=6306 RepID=A0A914N8K3_MELIC
MQNLLIFSSRIKCLGKAQVKFVKIQDVLLENAWLPSLIEYLNNVLWKLGIRFRWKRRTDSWLFCHAVLVVFSSKT